MVTNPILVALDYTTAEEAVRMAKRLLPHVGGFKVGLELMMGPGPATVAAVAELGLPVFADAKLHDIPNTVSRAARQLARYGARWVSVHALGSTAMLGAAVEALATVNPDAGVLAITVLTSLERDDLVKTGVQGSPGSQVARLSRLAKEAGVDGVVCAAKELGDVAQAAAGLLRVTPGVRPSGSTSDDQARVATPTDAISRGADYLVIGRPITSAASPEAEAAAIAGQLGLT